MQLQRHLLQEDLIEDCLRPRIAAVDNASQSGTANVWNRYFVGTNGAWVEGVKGACGRFRQAWYSVSHLLPESLCC